MIETLLEVRNLSKTFRYRTGWFRRQTVEAVKPLSFTLREGQTLAIIGENGSGKSTLAKMLAGMIEPTSGELLIDDHPLHFGDYSFRSQRIRMIFQDPMTSLDPTMTIGRQLTEGMRYHLHLSQADADKRAEELLEMVGIESPKERMKNYPHQLSGGMQQRTAIARALAYAPSFLLMDEPFAALDHFTRTQLQKELIRLQKSQNTGILFVTHSIDEALLLGHKIAFLEDGCIKKEFLLDTDCENRDLLSKELIELKREILAQLHL